MKNREIKFRAWDKQRNQFVGDCDIAFSDYTDPFYSVFPNSIDYIGDTVLNGGPQIGRFDIMQYTGLKDKNGVEIYERDILGVEDPEDNSKCVVIFDSGKFCKCYLPFYDQEYMDENFFTENDMIRPFTDFDLTVFKVIGNSCETPLKYKIKTW